MPEGPSIVIAREHMEFLAGRKITVAAGNAKIDLQRLEGAVISEFRSWGKHLLICFDGFAIRIHFMMFGSYLIDEEKDKPLRLGLKFGDKHQMNFYTCSVIFIDGPVDVLYDWSEDIMSGKWNERQAIKKVSAAKAPVCDVLLDQHIFSGSGNIIKNEVLYRTKIHPASMAANLPPAKVKALTAETRSYAFDLLKWKKEFTLSKHWIAYKKKVCKRCDLPLHRTHMGSGNRLTFYCDNCQVKY